LAKTCLSKKDHPEFTDFYKLQNSG
jgi:hypothetical protein